MNRLIKVCIRDKILKYAFTLLILFTGIKSEAQEISREVITGIGDYYSNSNHSLSWTLGEPMIETITDGTTILTVGFQQPNLFITAVEDNIRPTFDVSVYPNPAIDFITLKFRHDKEESINIEIFDIDGKRLFSEKKVISSIANEVVLSLKDLPVGLYMINIKSESGMVKTYRAQKID